MSEQRFRVPHELIANQLDAVFRAWGMADDVREAAVEIMVETDLHGIDSHGIAMLPLYALLKSQGKIVMRPEITLAAETAATALIDAGASLGHGPAKRAMKMAIGKAKAVGVGAVAVRNSNHFGAAGAYALMAAQAGLIGLSTTNAGSRAIVPTRASEPAFGTNPIAFAAPAGENPPFLADMATSTVAVGKVKLAYYAGKALPEGWALDDEGATVSDPGRAFDGNGRLRPDFGLTPLGGTETLASHKGYCLAAMVEILSGTLTGGPFIALTERAEHSTGHFFLALDPLAFGGAAGDFEDGVDAMIAALHGLKASDPARPVLVPGDPEHQARAERLEHGVPVPHVLAEMVRQVCREANVEYLLELGP